MAEVTPVTVLIGPGTGAVVHRLMARPDFADLAMVAAAPPQPIWARGGCSCCAPRDDVARALRGLLPQVRRDEKRHVLIEAPGVADPGPILATMLSDPVAAAAYRLDAIIAAPGNDPGSAPIGAKERLARQIAVADRVVLGGADTAVTSGWLCGLNPWAPVHRLDDVSGMAAAAMVLRRPDPGVGTATAASSERQGGAIRAFGWEGESVLSHEALVRLAERVVLTYGAELLRVQVVARGIEPSGALTIRCYGHLLLPPLLSGKAIRTSGQTGRASGAVPHVSAEPFHPVPPPQREQENAVQICCTTSAEFADQIAAELEMLSGKVEVAK